MKFCIPSLTHLNMTISHKFIWYVKNILLVKTLFKYTYKLPNTTFNQIFACLSCAIQNVASVMEMLRENCPCNPALEGRTDTLQMTNIPQLLAEYIQCQMPMWHFSTTTKTSYQELPHVLEMKVDEWLVEKVEREAEELRRVVDVSLRVIGLASQLLWPLENWASDIHKNNFRIIWRLFPMSNSEEYLSSFDVFNL